MEGPAREERRVSAGSSDGHGRDGNATRHDLLGRGDHTKLEKVRPACRRPPLLPTGVKADRLALAQWLVSPGTRSRRASPSTGIGITYFGQGIVKTTEDFGSQGEQPVHPELPGLVSPPSLSAAAGTSGNAAVIVTSQRTGNLRR